MQYYNFVLFLLTTDSTICGNALKRDVSSMIADENADLAVSLLSLRSDKETKAFPSVHFIYTTGCNDYQLTHSVVLDQSWRVSGNKGKLTRITAGCDTKEKRDLLSRSPLKDSADFSVFHAKGNLDTIPSTGEVYKARARPHALMQWMNNVKPTEDVIAIVDPDFVFLKPISEHPSLLQVKPGQMVSSSGWDRFGDGTNTAIPKEFASGPVWLTKASDLKTISKDWMALTDTWKKATDGLMREQFAFQEAAHKHNIPAVFDESLSTVQLSPGSEAYTMHYFMTYDFGSWGVHKALASSGWYADHFNNSVPTPIECGAPLLQEPPSPAKDKGALPLSIYTLVTNMNRGFRAYRESYCQGEKEAFQSKGQGAFGLSRTMHPIACPQHAGEITRYLVKTDEAASWDEEQALGGQRCSSEAQMLLGVSAK